VRTEETRVAVTGEKVRKKRGCIERKWIYLYGYHN